MTEYESKEDAVIPAGVLAVTSAHLCADSQSNLILAFLNNLFFFQFLVGQNYYSCVTIRLEVTARVSFKR